MTNKEIKELKGALRTIAKGFDSCGKEGSTCCGVTRPQWDVLVEIGEVGEISLVDLASALSLDTSTLSRTVNGMVMVGLLERVQSVTDRRFVTIKLSPKGIELLAQIDSIYEKQLAGVLGFIPSEQHGTVMEVLQSVAKAVYLSSVNEDSSCCF